MPRRKTVQKPKGESPQKAKGTTHVNWVWVALLAGLLFGGMSGYFIGQAASNGNSLIADRYGRTIGHPHYGHNHP